MSKKTHHQVSEQAPVNDIELGRGQIKDTHRVNCLQPELKKRRKVKAVTSEKQSTEAKSPIQKQHKC
ncbi:hypothetical protein [Vibrio sp. V36_P2S2PM302]|uniref:hypothetical protein n=1 Tax=unclassified Vibrio TaxID=2614977 RepID=UPI001F3F0901|nr:hypothetical protein [Vibrio sp. V36_P2S2PM302]